MNRTDNPRHPDLWDNDPLSRCISDHVQKMPDRPKVVVAIINQNREEDEAIVQSMADFKEAAIRVFALSFGEIRYTIFLFGFEGDFVGPVGKLLEVFATLPDYEGAIYVDRLARLVLAKQKGFARRLDRK